jgi:Membrane proteins related to metalloendopeptidases
VVATHEGVVTFAGAVAGSLHVVIDHGGGLRTSSSFLARVDVRRGQQVVRGQVIGAAGGSGPEHEIGVFHFGLRVGEDYVDPMRLFSPVDLAAVVRLVPVHAPEQAGLATPALEARSLAEALRLPRALPGLALAAEPSRWDQALDAGGDLVGGLIEVGTALTWPARTVGRFVIDHTPLHATITDLRSMASRFATYLRSRADCTTDATAGPGGGGSGHLLMAVGGINSHTDLETGHTFGLDTQALGYHRNEVNWFSYARGGSSYQASDTWGDLLIKAYALRNQLREVEAQHPGREVDLIAHSQGGVVVDVFMQSVYDPGDPTLPPLGDVVTLSSPHLGAPAASIAQEIRTAPDGRRLLDWAESLAGGAIPPSAGRSTRQLAEDSSLMRHLWRRPLPDQMDMTSIAAPDDAVVPADRTEAPGARRVTVDPSGVGDHSAIVDDPTAMREVRLALEHRAPGCVGLLQGVRGAIEPVLIRRVELNLGHLISGIAHHRLPPPFGLPIGIG